MPGAEFNSASKNIIFSSGYWTKSRVLLEKKRAFHVKNPAPDSLDNMCYCFSRLCLDAEFHFESNGTPMSRRTVEERVPNKTKTRSARDDRNVFIHIL